MPRSQGLESPFGKGGMSVHGNGMLRGDIEVTMLMGVVIVLYSP